MRIFSYKGSVNVSLFMQYLTYFIKKQKYRYTLEYIFVSLK